MSSGTASTEETVKSIDISVFMTDAVAGGVTHNDPYFPTKLIGAALEHTLTTLPNSGEHVDITVRTETTIIPEDELNFHPDNPVYAWDNAIDEHVPPEERGADTNLLITDADANIAGQAELPCDSCDGTDNTAAVVMNAVEPLNALSYDDATGPWDFSTPAHIVPIAIHETGHTLGLEHSHGTGTDGKPPEVTPMLGTYIFDEAYAGKENQFGDPLPDSPNTTQVICRDAFNPDISLTELTV